MVQTCLNQIRYESGANNSLFQIKNYFPYQKIPFVYLKFSHKPFKNLIQKVVVFLGDHPKNFIIILRFFTNKKNFKYSVTVMKY